MRRISLLLSAAMLAISAVPASASPGAAAEVGAPHARLSRISIQTIGKGDPVILIPGLASPRSVWDGVAPELAKRHRLILVQLNGFGGDDPGGNSKPGILPGAVSELAGYLADNKIEQPALIGHSMGGLVGMMLARDHPQAVGRLMIVDALPFFGVLMSPGATVEAVRPVA